MKINAMRCGLDSNEVMFAIQKTIDPATCKLKVALPSGWRLIVKVACRDTKEAPPIHELLHLDVQADEGGGSWAEAKIKTLEDHLGWSATHPMEIEELRYEVSRLKSCDCCAEAIELSEAKLYAELSPKTIEWLVDVDDGPGIAPGFGGIRVPYRCNFVERNNKGKPQMMDESGEVLIAFSGAKQWQDLQFALMVARAMENHWKHKEDEFLVMDFSQLKEWPEIEFWMSNLGLC